MDNMGVLGAKGGSTVVVDSRGIDLESATGAVGAVRGAGEHVDGYRGGGGGNDSNGVGDGSSTGTALHVAGMCSNAAQCSNVA